MSASGARPRIVVGLSGGVDSSLAAALLVEEGYEVVGVTLHLAGSASRCCSLDDAEDARRVAEQLGIRYFVANYRDEFRREVMEPFADAYLAGRTPIPCVVCNQRFKFGRLMARARPREGPDLLPLRPRPGAARADPLPARRAHEARGARARALSRPRDRGEARESGDLLRARR